MLPDASLAADTRVRLDEMLTCGTTTCEAKSGYGLTTASELRILRVVRGLANSHAIELTQTGVKLVEAAVENGVLAKTTLAVPYGNLSTMYQQMGEETNAAKYSRASEIDVYAEASDERAEVFVRDRGTGFDPGAVPADRRGVRESIVGRMERHGGRAEVRSAPGGGTEVELVLS